MRLLQPVLWYFRTIGTISERIIAWGDRRWAPVMVLVRVATFIACAALYLGPILLLRDAVLAATGLDIFGGSGDLGRECPYRYC